MKITVRLGQKSDLPQIVAAQKSMAMESEGLALDQNTLEKGVLGIFEKPQRGNYWIAEVDSKMAGMLLVVPEWSDWRNRDIWWIHSVYTWPEFRGQGVYKALYSSLKEKVLASDDLGGLRLYVETENLAAQKVYKKLGMRDDHYFMYEWLK